MPGVSCGGWSVISLFTCSLEHRMMERRSVRAVLKVTEPPIALRVLREKKKQGKNVKDFRASCFWTKYFSLWTDICKSIYRCHLHLSDCIPHTAELGQFVNAFLFDNGAVHVKTNSICVPEEFFCLWKRRHHAEKEGVCWNDNPKAIGFTTFTTITSIISQEEKSNFSNSLVWKITCSQWWRLGFKSKMKLHLKLLKSSFVTGTITVLLNYIYLLQVEILKHPFIWKNNNS